MHTAAGCSLNILKFHISTCHEIPRASASPVIPFPKRSVCFLSALCVSLCSLTPLSVENSCCQCVFLSWMDFCLICVAAALGSCCMDDISVSVNQVKSLKGVTSASPFCSVKRPVGREGGILAFFPDTFRTLIPSSVILCLLRLLPPSVSQ